MNLSSNAASYHDTDLPLVCARTEYLTSPITLYAPLNYARTISPSASLDDVSNTLRSRDDKSILPRSGEVSWPRGLLELIRQASQGGWTDRCRSRGSTGAREYGRCQWTIDVEPNRLEHIIDGLIVLRIEELRSK
jgi:hypothetical protein